MAAQQFFRLHGEEISIEHGLGLYERLGEPHRRQLDGKAARLQHAALDVARPRTQMRVTRVDLAPGVDDADDRPARPIVGVVAELAQPRAVSERAQIVDAEPAMAAQIFRTLASHGGDPDTGVIRAVCAGFILSRALGGLPSPLWLSGLMFLRMAGHSSTCLSY